MDMLNVSLITMVWELYCHDVPQIQIAKDIGRNRDTVRLWINGIKRYGLREFLDLYENAKKGKRTPRKADTLVKSLIYEIRDREMDCCGQKIQYFLNLEHNIHLSVPKIYQILAEKYVIRSKWKKNKERGPVVHPTKPREIIQMDTVDFGDIFAFTGVDCFTKEVDVILAPELTSEYGYRFLTRSMNRRFNNYSEVIQNDGGPEFKDKFKLHVLEFCGRHRVARPYKKNEQSFIESFNRTLRKECLGWIKYNTNQLTDCTEMVESFLERYHSHRPHMGLNMQTPNNFIKQLPDI